MDTEGVSDSGSQGQQAVELPPEGRAMALAALKSLPRPLHSRSPSRCTASPKSSLLPHPPSSLLPHPPPPRLLPHSSKRDFFQLLIFVLFFFLLFRGSSCSFLNLLGFTWYRSPRPDSPQGPAVPSQGGAGGGQPSSAQGCSGHVWLPINTFP